MAKSRKASTKQKAKKNVVPEKPITPVEAVPELPKADSMPAADTGKPSLRMRFKASLSLEHLNRWNKWLAVVYAVQGLALLAFSSSHAMQVTTSFLNVDPIASEVSGKTVLGVATKHLFDVNMAILVALILFVAAIGHAIVAGMYRKRYEADLARGVNRVRWIELSMSVSLMMVVVGFLSGVADLSTLLLLFGASVLLHLTCLAMELYAQGQRRANWLLYGLACVAGALPWVVFALYAVGAEVYGSGHIQAFVYWIYATSALTCGGFALAMYLRYTKKGDWANYLHVERTYMILSLVAKTALAWQVFAGLLRP